MIVFDGEQIVGVFFLDQVGGGVVLGVQGIKTDDLALDLERIQKGTDGCDLIGFRVNLPLSDHGTLVLEKSAEEMDLASVFLSCPSEGFSVNGDVVVRVSPPTAQGLVDRFGVDSLHVAADRGLAGWNVALLLVIVPAVEAFEHFLRAALRPFGNGCKAPGVTHDGAKRDGQNGDHLMPPAPGFARIRHV